MDLAFLSKLRWIDYEFKSASFVQSGCYVGEKTGAPSPAPTLTSCEPWCSGFNGMKDFKCGALKQVCGGCADCPEKYVA